MAGEEMDLDHARDEKAMCGFFGLDCSEEIWQAELICLLRRIKSLRNLIVPRFVSGTLARAHRQFNDETKRHRQGFRLLRGLAEKYFEEIGLVFRADDHRGFFDFNAMNPDLARRRGDFSALAGGDRAIVEQRQTAVGRSGESFKIESGG